METAAILQIVGLLSKVTVGIATAYELNQRERIPVLRAHAERIDAMVSAGTVPSQDEIDALAAGIQSDIDFVHTRADQARQP